MTLFSYGFSLAVLVRGEGGRWLAEGDQERVVLEGEIRPGDLFLLATARAKELGLKLDSLIGRPADDVSLLFSRIQTHPHSGEIAVLAVQFAPPAEETRAAATLSIQESKPDSEIIPENISRPMIAPRHLIAPEKIEQGILASEEEKASRIKRTIVKKELFSGLAQSLRHRKNLLWLAAGIGLIFLLILAMVIYRGAALEKERKDVVVPLEQLVSTSLALPPEKIGEQRAAVQSLLERLRATRVTYGSNQRRVRELLTLIEEKNGTISGEKQLVNLPIFYDFRLISAEFLASKAAREKNQSVFVDGGSGVILSLNLDTKQNETYPREGIAGPLDIALTGNTAYILQSGKIMKAAASQTKADEVAALGAVREPLLLDRFGETLYIFDRSGQQIWRLPLVEDATPSGWIKSARGVDFSAVTSLAINGSIWLGSSDGNIYEFVRGERQSFSVSGLVEPFTSSLYLAVTEEGERLAVVEPAKKRLVLLNKQGEYQQQVESEQIGAVTDVFLAEDEKSAYLVAGSVVYKVDL